MGMVIDGCNRQDHDVLLCCYPFTDSVNGYSIREWGGTVATRSGEQTQLRKIIRFAAGGLSQIGRLITGRVVAPCCRITFLQLFRCCQLSGAWPAE